ncbi:MAG: acyl-CoA dehydrogenase, partial [Mesorhizobium sp.]|uniref:acyl-CoA dehydrogenase C-terminal domain-containing protein n=1 Tax=Mesorhizobium sp. TaxID=1871066 RepID=UPI001AC48F45
WRDRANLLTPLAKAFSTDVGVEVASLGVQVHGGMGFIEETGAAALYRDARIAPIYEGTNGIQAIDLVVRKLPLGGGEHVHGFIGELAAVANAVRTSNLPGLGRTADALDAALGDLTLATRFLQKQSADGQPDKALAGATPYLRLISLAAGGAYLARGALADQARIGLCRFFTENLLGETRALKDRVIDGGESLADAGKTLISA